jgi:L-arabinokinase
VLAAYVTGHGFGHLTRLCEVLRAVRARAPALPITVVGAVPGPLVERALGSAALRAIGCDVGLVQRGPLDIDEAASAAACRAFEATWDERVAAEAAFLRASGARLVVADVPPLAFAAAAAAGVPAVAVTNFSWDWIYRHLAARQPSLADAAARAAHAYQEAALLLELPYAGDLAAFTRREQVGFVARRPSVAREEARRRLGLDGRPAVLLSFGGTGMPAVATDRLVRHRRFRFLLPEELGPPRLDALGLGYVDVVGAADVVLTKPGYGIVTDAIGAGTRLVYTERGDFPEYPILVREMPRHLACTHVSNEALRAGDVVSALDDVLARTNPPPPDLGGAARAAERLLSFL